jgi:AcrR family transcriptional regulator
MPLSLFLPKRDLRQPHKAGIAKGTLYRYFDNKESLFKAVVQNILALRLQDIEENIACLPETMTDFIPTLLHRAAGSLGESRLPAMIRMVLTEFRTLPGLAKIWHDELTARMLAIFTKQIMQAQARGEVRPGDLHLYAFSIMGPMITGALFHEVFGSELSTAPDLIALATQHAELVLRGLLIQPND